MSGIILQIVSVAAGRTGTIKRRNELRIRYVLQNGSAESIFVYNRLLDEEGQLGRASTTHRTDQLAHLCFAEPDTVVLLVGHAPRPSEEARVTRLSRLPEPMATRLGSAKQLSVTLRTPLPLAESSDSFAPRRDGPDIVAIPVRRLRLIVEYVLARDVTSSRRHRQWSCWDIQASEPRRVEAERNISAERLALLINPDMVRFG
jgi:hypothetical protein